MVQTLNVWAMAENSSPSLASHAGSDPGLRKFETKRDVRAINMCHVHKGGGNNWSPLARM